MSKKKDSAPRKTWTGYYTRKTKTRREKEISIERKHKNLYNDARASVQTDPSSF